MEEQQEHQHQHDQHQQGHSQETHHQHVQQSHSQPQQQPRREQYQSSTGQQSTFQHLKQQLHSFWLECIRVFRVTKKPDRQEFLTTLKISGLGILLIGAIGFVIFVMKEVLMKFL